MAVLDDHDSLHKSIRYPHGSNMNSRPSTATKQVLAPVRGVNSCTCEEVSASEEDSADIIIIWSAAWLGRGAPRL